MVSSSSASQSEATADERGDASGEGVERKCKVGLGSDFLLVMALFQLLILEPVRSMAPAFLFVDRLRPGVWESEGSGRGATLTDGLDVFEEGLGVLLW